MVVRDGEAAKTGAFDFVLAIPASKPAG
jgi:hypothetical protein